MGVQGRFEIARNHETPWHPKTKVDSPKFGGCWEEIDKTSLQWQKNGKKRPYDLDLGGVSTV